MNKEMKKRLSEYIGTDTLVSIYSNPEEPNSFILGYILQIDEYSVLINMVDSFGEECGFCIINIDDIFVYNEDKIYNQKMQKLFEIKNQERKYIGNLTSNAMSSFLNYATDNKVMVQVNDDDNCVGYVSYFSPKVLELQMVDTFSNDIGTASIDMSYIYILECQTKHLRDLDLLHSRK